MLSIPRTLILWIPLMLCLGWLVSPAVSAPQNADSGTWRFGVWAGWAQGLGWDFDWHYRSSLSDKTSLGFHIGGSVRRDFSKYFGLQIDLDHQFASNQWTFTYWNFPKQAGEKHFGITTLSLQPVLHVMVVKRLRIFFQGGGGLCFGSWGDYGGFSDLYYHLAGGLGAKFSLTSSGSAPALVLGGMFQHLMDPESGAVRTADFIRFQLGLEF